MRTHTFFLILVLAAFPVSTHAQTFGGIGTRAEGMGGAFVAVADDASAAYWNPAGIATGATFDLQVSPASVRRGEDRPDLRRTPERSTVFVGAAMPVMALSYYRTHQ